MLLATGCLDYERMYELFTRNEIRTGAKYFQDSTMLFVSRKVNKDGVNPKDTEICRQLTGPQEK